MNNHDHSLEQWQHSDYMQDLRQRFLANQRPPECQACWEREDAGLVSQRQIINNNLTNDIPVSDSWIASYLRHYSDQPQVMMADVKVSNVCNFACVMCGPADSSRIQERWRRDPGAPHIQQALDRRPDLITRIELVNEERRSYQWLDEVLSQPLRTLKVLGGEPLLDRRLLRRLQAMPTDAKSRINLQLTTNGSQDLLAAVELLEGFQHVGFVVSLEGIQDMQHWARSGSDWSQIERHVLAARRAGITVSVHHTLQAATVLRLPELLRWCEQHDIVITFGLLENPRYLALGVLKPRLRDQALCQLSDWPSVRELAGLDAADPESQQAFADYISWYDRQHDISLLEIIPDMKDQL